jgi:hypothetical protein
MFRTIHKLTSLSLVVLASLGLGTAPRAEVTIAKSQREALVFIADLSQGDAAQRAFYDFVEFGAEALAHINLDPNYGAVTYVKGAATTRARLSDELDRITNRSTVKAVDLIFVTHGLDSKVLFANGKVSMTTVRNDILSKLTINQRKKLRAVFSTACFGSSHRTAWLQSGFKVASGSRKIYADSAVSYAPFLVAWANGATFSQAVALANAADVGNAMDVAAMTMYLLMGRPDLAAQVDSHRLVSGLGGLRINKMP